MTARGKGFGCIYNEAILVVLLTPAMSELFSGIRNCCYGKQVVRFGCERLKVDYD